MEVEFRVESDHLGWDDPAIEPAIEKYTSPFWPFGRRGKAQDILEEKQNEILERNGIEENSQLGVTVLKVEGVETEEEAREEIESFKEDIDQFYRDEFKLDRPLEISMRETTTI